MVELDIPEGITFIGKYFFNKNKTLKKCSIPATVSTIEQCVFEAATGLEELVFEHTEDSALKEFPNWMVQGCSSLKALSMPDCITAMTGVAQFARCTNMTALYLSKNLESINCESGGHASFFECTNMYFVNEPFTYDSIPTKPSVYYFPEKLTSLPSGGEVFKNCKNLNDVLVFPEGVTEIANGWAFNGANAVSIVFLGDMTNVSTTGNAWNSGITIYFCNVNDVSADSLTMTTNAKKVFCNAEGNTTHLTEKTVTEPAKCEVDAGKYTYCFCGYVISKEAIEGTALSHDYDYVNGKGVLVSLNYTDLSLDGTKTVKCGLCEKEDSTIIAKRLFNYVGYSTNDKGDMCVGYDINLPEINEYEGKYGKLNYGFVASANNDTPLSTKEGAVGNAETNAIKIELDENKYTRIDFALFTDNWEDEKVAAAKITLNMYLIVNNEVKYITGNGCSDIAEAYTYSEIK